MLSSSKVIRVGILGFGTVGSGTYQMLAANKEAIEGKVGFPVEVVKIGIKNATKQRELPPEMFTTDLDSIVNDPNIDVILELIGGIDPAARLVETALSNGKSVVTANKELMAKQGSRLVHLAKSKKLDLHYEAAVGGGIPLIQPLKHQLSGNEVLRMMGILNGTTNYILTRMMTEGADFEDVLADAQALGYAESDPTNDVDGIDAAYKISILASIGFGKQVPIEAVYVEGIRKVSKEDMAYAELFGYRVKLIGIVDAITKDKVRVRVHPTMLPKAHPLASVNGVYNGLWFQGNFVGDVMFSGRGAGSHPTASAVMGDLIDVGRNIFIDGPGSAVPYELGMQVEPMDSLETMYYLRAHVKDRPRVLGAIAVALGDFDVSLAAMEMKTVIPGETGEIVFMTHKCREDQFLKAVLSLASLDAVAEIHNWIRVEA